ncbi:MAG: GNAT family N-acetyltransferase [Proteobacteria bacterium]|nr:GNAT family N-acetyltransferase [Pseudomonadota bacterium]
MALSFRPASAADADTVRAITRAAYAKWVPLIGREPLPMRADPLAAIRNHRVELACEGADPVAVVEMVPEPGCLLVENVAVRPDRQKLGYGDAILGRIEQVARSLRLPAVRLYTNKRFETNVAWYARRGFAVTREEEFASGGIAVHMRWTLPVEIA